MYRSVILSDTAGWISPVRVLTTPFERLDGLGGSTDHPVMLLTRSIHTFTMRQPISVAVLDVQGLVLSHTVMVPRRVKHFGAKRWVIETLDTVALPTPGTRVVATTMPEPCPEH